MPRVRVTKPVLVLACCATLLSACRSTEGYCPVSTVEVDPPTIPEGESRTDVLVTVDDPNPDNGREVLTELSAESGSFDDPTALMTRYACAHDVSGEVEICADVRYGPPIGPAPGSLGEGIAAAIEYLGPPHAYFVRPEDCLETSCTKVVCPNRQNFCPEINAFTADPEVITEEGQTATLRVTAEDADSGPAPLVTTMTAIAGTITNRQEPVATYECDPNWGGPIEICVDASDGDESCNVKNCLTVQCPGEPPNNVCPVIRDLTATPTIITKEEDDLKSVIEVDAFDPDMKPEPLRTFLSATAGTFEDRDASTTIFTCGNPGDAVICARATDGDRTCETPERERCITVRCPEEIDYNECPKLYTVNAIPTTIPEGSDSTEIEVRAADNDGGPLPLTTTLYALRGTFDDVNAADTIYRCERSGLQEICADATDGSCVKTLCEDVICPNDL